MGIISYAQNFEDVMLWRALKHVENGFYIDIGAHDPVIDSVSKAFYDNGWRGVHIEPLPGYCDALRKQRPDEEVLQAAVAQKSGSIVFYEIPDTGISTASKEIAESHVQNGFTVNKINVPCMTLQQVFDHVGRTEIHWLKIDVEGLEKEVLKGWGRSLHRPWIVVLESTLPGTQQESYKVWEDLLTSREYSFVYFDGLNRFYLSKEHDELKSSFNAGPNIFDGFQLAGNAVFCRYVEIREKENCAKAMSDMLSLIHI